MVDLDDFYDAFDEQASAHPYHVLGLTRDLISSVPSDEAAGLAVGFFRVLARTAHPDRGGSAERFSALREALDVIESDPAGTRATYLEHAAAVDSGASVISARATSIGALIAELMLPSEPPKDVHVLFASPLTGTTVTWQILPDRSISAREADIALQADAVVQHDADDGWSLVADGVASPLPFGAPRRASQRRVVGSYAPSRAASLPRHELPTTGTDVQLPPIPLRDATEVLLATEPAVQLGAPIVVLNGRRSVTVTARPVAVAGLDAG